MKVKRNIGYIFVLLLIGRALSAEMLDLPKRQNPTPQTTNNVPHIQIGIAPKPELSAELLRRVAEIPDVHVRDTVISLPGAKGFWIDDSIALAHPEAIVGGREFAHLHPDGSLHASLSPELAEKASQAGWTVAHPWADQREGWDGFVMIFTPQNPEELEMVYNLVLQSYAYVTGQELSQK